jgi:hypothetical protein
LRSIQENRPLILLNRAESLEPSFVSRAHRHAAENSFVHGSAFRHMDSKVLISRNTHDKKQESTGFDDARFRQDWAVSPG